MVRYRYRHGDEGWTRRGGESGTGRGGGWYGHAEGEAEGDHQCSIMFILLIFWPKESQDSEFDNAGHDWPANLLPPPPPTQLVLWE